MVSEEQPTSYLYLENAVAEVTKMKGPTDSSGMFEVRVKKWHKEGRKPEPARHFVFAAESQEAAEDWVYKIKYVIESSREQSKERKSLPGAQTPDDGVRRTSVG
jgi:hypothetical protein